MDKLLMRKLREEKSLLLDTLARVDRVELENKKIMVIDDCEDTLNLLRRYLAKESELSVETFIDEFDAMRRFIHEKPDLIILDMNLSQIDGIKVSVLMSKLNSLEVPTIFISRDKKVKDKVSRLAEGKKTFINKPIHQEKLLSSVRSLLAS